MYKGISASTGIGIRKVVIVEEIRLTIAMQTVTDVEEKMQRLRGVLDETTKAIGKLAEGLATRVNEKGAKIMQGRMMFLADPMLTGETKSSIRSNSVNSEYTIENVRNMCTGMFASMGDELVQQRVTDMRDIKTRTQQMLMRIQSVDISSLPEDGIIVAKDLTPSVTAGINLAKVADTITELDGRTSHSAVLVRALGIPAMVAVTGFVDGVKGGDQVVLGGNTGEVCVDPGQAVAVDYEEKRKRFLVGKKELEQYVGKPSVARDGVQVEIVTDIGRPEDADKVPRYDGEGIGLFRTGFLFMDRNVILTEEGQFEAYKKAAVTMNGKPVIIRILDIGGDKGIPCMDLGKDENPFLDYWVIRLCPDRGGDVYKPQLRALLRVSTSGNIRIMVPLIVCIEEYRQAKTLVEGIKKELDGGGIAHNRDVQVGIMVEIAAASLIADILAKGTDFFSIGTNNLAQYTISVDRGNRKVSYLYSTFDPAVLRSIKHITAYGHEADIIVGMRGRAASDPTTIPLLLASGFNELSMSMSIILEARKMATQYSAEEFQAVADKAMSPVTVAEIE